LGEFSALSCADYENVTKIFHHTQFSLENYNYGVGKIPKFVITHKDSNWNMVSVQP